MLFNLKKIDKDFETESAKEKKGGIPDLFKNKHFLGMENYRKASRNYGNIFINKRLSETIINYLEDLVFKIDKIDKTASLYKINGNIKEVTIPRAVKYESTDYLITSISGTSSFIEKINFTDDSAVKMIDEYVFPDFSNIKEIHFPASLKELKKRWCHNINKLTK